MEILKTINLVILILFTVSYAYQFVYIPVPWLKKAKPHKQAVPHRFAVLICARNESSVIADLIESIRNQTYDASLVHIFVLADNCTDNTAQIARDAGATVYERFNKEKVGKGYALQTLLRYLGQDYPDSFDGYFVFDADNILAPDYIERMNETFSDGHQIITSYRNSKNYGDNWISAGYALWFLRESRYLNHPRFLLNTSCAVSGTGFFFSHEVLQQIGPWPFHLLTEDIEFSIYHVTQGHKIAFCPDAVLYDEQPTSFRQSWRQRTRWAKGYMQVFACYGKDLVKGALKGNFSCFDMSMSIMPAFFLSAISIICNVALTVMITLAGGSLSAALEPALGLLFSIYNFVFVIGIITTITEWKQIHTSTAKKILYIFTFPLFMATYIPISVAALFQRNVQWKPIEHRVSAAQLRERKNKDLLPF